jgi:hypothetical protein
MRTRPFTILSAFLILIASTSALYAQRFEIGGQVTGVHLHKIDEAPVGVGVRFHYNVVRFAAADIEVSHYPENSAGDFGETTSLSGIRAGKRWDRFGAFMKGRMGWIHFGGEYFVLRLDHRTHLMTDLGGMLEFYPSPHTFLRLEGGDTIIYYGDARLFNRPNPDALGTVHNFQPAVGFGFRF